MFEKVLSNIIKYGLLVIPFLPLYVASGLFFPFITGKNFAFRIIIEILFAAWIILALKLRAYRPGKSAITLSVLAFTVILLLSTIFSIDPARSFWSNAERMEGFFGLLHVFAFFLIATSVFTTKDWLRFFWISLGVSVLVSGHGILQLLGKAEIHQGGVRVDANFGNATYLAIYLIFHIFLALYFITRYRIKWLRFSLALLVLLELFILYNTATRGAIIGLLAGLFLTGALVTFFSSGRARRWGIAALLVAVVVPLLFLALKNTSLIQESEVLQRFATISTIERTTQSRFLIWGMAFDGWQDRPILGLGLENFTTVFAQYYRPQLWQQEPWFDRAHNVFLDWLTAAGILGLLAYLSLFASAVALLLKLYRRGSDPRNGGQTPVHGGFSALQSSLFAGLLAAYFVHNLFVFDNLISYVMFFAILGFIHSQTTNYQLLTTNSEPLVRNYWWRVGLSSLATIGILFSLYAYNVKPIKANSEVLKAVQAFTVAQGGDAKGIDDGINEAKKALARETFLTVEMREQLASYAQGIRDVPTLAAEKRIALIDFAVSEMEQQLERSPLDMRARMFLLFLYEASGNLTKGVALGQETVNLAPTRQIYRFLYGSLLSQQGVRGEAIEQFRIAFEMDPTYPEAVDYYALVLLQFGDDSFASDLTEGRFAESLRANPAFRRQFTNEKDLEGALDRYRGISPRFAQTYASLGNYDTAARIYAALIEQKIAGAGTPDANYFVQYALLKVELGERADAIAMLERMKEFYTNPQHLKEIDDFIAEIRAGKTAF